MNTSMSDAEAIGAAGADRSSEAESSQQSRSTSREWTAYIPLIVLIAVVAAAAGALMASAPQATMYAWMRRFMGLFLCVFAMFKLFDIPGFADGFSMYDLLAKRVKAYGYVYPFIELGLGLMYLADAMPIATNAVLMVVMLFGVTGVLLALRRGLDVNCACMGTALDVPLSTVAVVEDLGMAAMAAAMLGMILL